MDEWIRKSAIKREILLLATTWKDCEGIMLNEISQRKTKSLDLTYTCNQGEKAPVYKNRLVVARDCTGRADKMGEEGQMVQIPSYKTNKP